MSHHPLFLAGGLLRGLGNLTAGFLGLGYGLDDTNSDGLEKDVSILKVKGIKMPVPVSCRARRNVPKVGNR